MVKIQIIEKLTHHFSNSLTKLVCFKDVFSSFTKNKMAQKDHFISRIVRKKIFVKSKVSPFEYLHVHQLR